LKTGRGESALSKWLRPVLIGATAGVLCCIGVLLLFALLMAVRDIPQPAVTPMAVIAAAVGSFFGGFVSARAAGSRGLVFGAATGALIFLLIVIAGFSFLHDIRGWYALIKLLVVVISSTLGGIYGVNFRRRK